MPTTIAVASEQKTTTFPVNRDVHIHFVLRSTRWIASMKIQRSLHCTLRSILFESRASEENITIAGTDSNRKKEKHIVCAPAPSPRSCVLRWTCSGHECFVFVIERPRLNCDSTQKSFQQSIHRWIWIINNSVGVHLRMRYLHYVQFTIDESGAGGDGGW